MFALGGCRPHAARLPELLPQADLVVLALPLTRETAKVIGERELRAVKRTAFPLNIGRGKLIDEPGMVRALPEGSMAGAKLDVFEEEPLPPGLALCDMENVIVPPHYGGASPRYYERATPIFLGNLRRYREGEPLRNLVDKQAWRE